VRKQLIIFASAAAISSIGGLPLGTLNVTAMHIAQHRGTAAGLWFAWGALLIEIVYVYLTLKLFEWLSASIKTLTAIRWISIAVMLGIGIWLLVENADADMSVSTAWSKANPFLTGLLLSALNPAQIPFWLGWNAVAIDRKILRLKSPAVLVWLMGIGTGTFLSLGLFAVSGPAIFKLIGGSDRMLTRLIGMIFILAALLQSLNVIRINKKQKSG
jgi:threonine/homoserine/homoserine lactone efflux protein